MSNQPGKGYQPRKPSESQPAQSTQHQHQHPSASSSRPGDNRICFKCGLPGHISPNCTNPPLPPAEQAKIRKAARYQPRPAANKTGQDQTKRAPNPWSLESRVVEIPTTSLSAAVRFTEIDDAGDERVEGWNRND